MIEMRFNLQEKEQEDKKCSIFAHTGELARIAFITVHINDIIRARFSV